MTRNTLIGGVLAGILFLGDLTLAEDLPKDSSTASNEPTGSVEASKQSRIHLGGISVTGGYSRYSGPGYWGLLIMDTMIHRIGLLSGRRISHMALAFPASTRPTIFSVVPVWAKSNCRLSR